MAQLNHNQTEGFYNINAVTEHFQCIVTAGPKILFGTFFISGMSLLLCQVTDYLHRHSQGVCSGCQLHPHCTCTPGREIKILGAEFMGVSWRECTPLRRKKSHFLLGGGGCVI